ncbi:MAG: hypothetical protein IPG55_09730 [Saprospiraceae bacterium]|nr:hypothetical protein [Candidatus Defluviibacterium haderslevense]MBK7243871.1 hypothetical protein [Candidatus Defluviibacterium haderslevense]
MKPLITILITISLISCDHKFEKNNLATLKNVYDLNCNFDLLDELKQTKNHFISLDSTFYNHGSITQNIKNVYRNKILYVDVWFVGCPGCKYQEPFFKSLFNKFINKNISFISFCLYSDREEAVNYIAKNEIPGDHYLLNIKQTEQFENIYEISSYPTYLIFDKHMKLQFGDAPRPNSEGIEKLLQTLME